MAAPAISDPTSAEEPDAGSEELRLSEVLTLRHLRVVFQPIVDLETHEIYAYETLARPDRACFPGPMELFDSAARHACAGELGRIVRSLGISGCPRYPLFLNVHPSEFAEGWLVRPDDPIFSHEQQIYLEITESVPLSHFRQCHSVLREIRSKGVMLAVDDLGSGYSNLKYIADLTPEIVKLDRSLVTSAPGSPRHRKLIANIVRLCVELGAKVVGEGIETLDELGAVVDAGAHFGQGYYFARPSNPAPLLMGWSSEAPTRH